MIASLETSANTRRTHPSRHCSTKTPIDFSVEHVFTSSFQAVIHSKMLVRQAVFGNEIPIQTLSLLTLWYRLNTDSANPLVDRSFGNE